jgi:peroxiredoxin
VRESYKQDMDELAIVSQALERGVTQSGANIAGLSAMSPLLLVFLRHAGCPFCREALADIARSRRAIEQGGTRIVLVHMGDTAAVERLLARYGLLGLDRICDPNRELYRAFGLGRGRLRQLFGLKVLWRGVVKGLLVRHGFGRSRADAFQMPGVFWIDNCVLARRYRHRTAADRPNYAELCAIRSAAGL